MHYKTNQGTASTYHTYTPVNQNRKQQGFMTPRPFTISPKNTHYSSIRDVFESFRKDLWEEGLIKGMTQNQKQTLNNRIDNLENDVSDFKKKQISDLSEEQSKYPDHTQLLLAKENEIIVLQKKINNLQNRMLGHQTKNGSKISQKQLRENISKLSNELKNKETIIKNKNDFILSEFSQKTQIKQTLFKIKGMFDKAAKKGDLSRLFDGICMPQNTDYSIEQLVKDNPKSYRRSLQGQDKIKKQIEILMIQLNKSVISSQLQLENLLTSFILELQNSQLKQNNKQNVKLVQDHSLLMTRFKAAAGIWNSQIKDLKRQFPTSRIDIDNGITRLLEDSSVNVSFVNNVVQLQPNPIIQVPMAESKTSQILLTICKDVKRIISKYPKIETELSTSITQFFNEGIIEFMEVGNDPNKIIQIVRYLPQDVKSDNHIYTFDGDKNKRLEFHLRVLLKTLLQELDRVKKITGQVLQLDESIIKMIQEEVLDVVNVDDILKVFKVNTKIVQVEKIVEKIVERVVQVPQIVPIQKVVQKIIEVPKIQQIEKIVNIPVEVIKIVDNVVQKIVQVERVVEIIREIPKVVEKIVQKIVQVPKIVEVEKVVEKIIVQTEIVEVQKVVNNVVYEVKEVQNIVQKIVTVQKVVQKIIEVPVYTQKIVQKLVQIPTIVEVEKVVEKVVKDTEIKVVKQNNLQIEVAIQVVDRIVQKIVVVDNYIQKLVEVPKIIQKIVQVRSTETNVKQVEVVRQKIVHVYEVKQIQKVVNTLVPLIKEVQKIVQKRIQVPFYEQKLVTVPQIITRVEIQRIEIPRIIEVEKVVEKVVVKNNIVQIQKPVIHYVTDYQIVKNNIQKIVPIPKIVQKIKQVKVNVEKPFQKIVEVPKVVEVEKLVEKIVVVPRIIQKIVQIPQIVQTVVERIVEVEKVVEIEKIIQVPVYKQKIVELEVVKNVYIEVQKVVDRVVEKIVPFQTIVERVVEISNDIQRIIPLKKEVPKHIQVQKVVTNTIQVQKLVQIQKAITVPIEVPVEVERIVQKVVVVQNNFEKIVQVPQIIQRIVEIHTQVVEVQEVERIVQRIIPKNVIQTVTEDNVIVQNRVEAVPAIVEKLVPVKQIVKQIVQVQKIVQKVVQRIVQVPKIVQIQRIVEKIIKVPEYIELEKIVPQLIKVNSIVETIVERIVSVPVIQEVVKSIPTEVQKIVTLKQTENKIKQIEVLRDKIIQVQRVVEVDHTTTLIQKQLEVIERFEQISVPIYSTIEKIIEVPQILEKIVQKIVMMPQVVEVIKNIHHIPDSVGNPIPQEMTVKEEEYRSITNNFKKNLDVLVSQLRKLKPQHPSLKGSIQKVQKMFVELQKAVSYNRVVNVPCQVVVEKEVTKPVIVNNIKINKDTNLALAILTEKLVSQLLRIKKQRGDVKLNLDEDIMLTFFSEFSNSGVVNLQYQKQLRSYTESVLSKFRRLGGWKTDHEMIILNTLQQKFANTQLIKNMNDEMRKLRTDLNTSNSTLRPLKQSINTIVSKYQRFQESLQKLIENIKNQKINGLSDLKRNFIDFSSFIKHNLQGHKTQPITRAFSYSEKEVQSMELDRLNSKLRQSFSQIETLKNQFVGTTSPNTPRTIHSEDELRKEIKKLQQQLSTGFNSLSQRQMRIQYQAKLRDQAASYEKQLNQLKTYGYKEGMKDQTTTGSSSHRYTNTGDRSRLVTSRIMDSSHQRVLTSPSSVEGYNSPSNHVGKSMFSSIMIPRMN